MALNKAIKLYKNAVYMDSKKIIQEIKNKKKKAFNLTLNVKLVGELTDLIKGQFSISEIVETLIQDFVNDYKAKKEKQK